MGLGEISLGEMGLGEMGLGEMGQNRPNTWRWQTSRWCHAAALGKRKTSAMGCHSSRYLCRFIPRRHCNNSRGSSWQGGKFQGGQIQATDQQPLCLFQLLLKQQGRGTMHLSVELIQELGRRISAVTQIRHKRNRFRASAAVCGFTTRICGLLPQHLYHRINVAVVILLFFNIIMPAALC